MTSRVVIGAALIGAIALAALVFGLHPALDLKTAALFYKGDGTFLGDTSLGGVARRIFYWIPTGMLVLCLALPVMRRLGRGPLRSPNRRGILFLLLTFAVGPGLIANTLLKDHSHRPRPYQTVEFGGKEPFRPFYRFDGACDRNCSFVSGEGATSAWTLGPALLVPPPWTAAAVGASLVFAFCSGALRMAFGGHYLSDAVFAVLFSWVVLWLGWIVIHPREAGPLVENPIIRRRRR